MPLILLIFLLFTCPLTAQERPTVLMHPGIETEESVYCVQALKHTLQKQFPSLRFLVTRHQHEKPTHENTTSFVNRIAPHLYLSIHLTQDTTASLHTYTYIQHPVTDYWHQKTSPLDFIPLSKAHIAQSSTSKKIAEKLVEQLHKEFSATPHVAPLCSFPFKPLAGIQAPAVALELSLPRVKEWRVYTSLLETAFTNLIRTFFEKELSL